MPQAKIMINAVDGSNDDLPVNTLVQLDNHGIGGETTYLWALLDQPPGPLDSLSSLTIHNPTFTPRKEGTYLLQLIVNQGTGSQHTNTVVAAIRQVKTRERVPAAGETLEDSTARGWANAAGSLLQRLDKHIADPGYVMGLNDSGGTLNVGDVVELSDVEPILTGLPGQTDIPYFEKALATTTAVYSLIGVCIGSVDGTGSPVSDGGLLLVRHHGIVEGLPITTGSFGDPLYVDDTGAISRTPGTYNRKIGRLVRTNGVTAIAWIETGIGAPLSLPFETHGVPGTPGVGPRGALGFNNLGANTDKGLVWANLAATGATERWSRVLEAGRKIAAKTTDYTVLAEDYRTVFSDFGSSGLVIFTMPTGGSGVLVTDGFECEFAVETNNGLRVVFGGSDVCRLGDEVTTATTGSLQSNVQGSYIKLVCLRPGVFQAAQVVGSWVVA